MTQQRPAHTRPPGQRRDTLPLPADPRRPPPRMPPAAPPRCAADSYDRAARAAHGRIPARSHDSDQLRRTARLIALAGNLTGDITLTAIALMGQLVALAD